MTVPEVTEEESYYDSNDQSITGHFESNYGQTVHSFYNEEDGIVTAENSDNIVCVDIEGVQEYFGAQNMFEDDDKKELVPSG